MSAIATHAAAYFAASAVHPGASKFHRHASTDGSLAGFTFALRGGRTYAWITPDGAIGATPGLTRDGALQELHAATTTGRAGSTSAPAPSAALTVAYALQFS